jgi:hypothetical protein
VTVALDADKYISTSPPHHLVPQLSVFKGVDVLLRHWPFLASSRICCTRPGLSPTASATRRRGSPASLAWTIATLRRRRASSRAAATRRSCSSCPGTYRILNACGGRIGRGRAPLLPFRSWLRRRGAVFVKRQAYSLPRAEPSDSALDCPSALRRATAYHDFSPRLGGPLRVSTQQAIGAPPT